MISILVVGTTPARAQSLDRGNARATLSGALIRLNRNPQDGEALIAAGNAALATGDTDAALGFFTRADRLLPNNPRIEAGLASAEVRAEDPFSALPLFVAAEKGGALAPELLGDRGLAFDLIGDNTNAQRYYRQALAGAADTGANAGPRAEISRRLALSLAIAGDRLRSETVLSSLLQVKDRAAWRARIFALAILGYEEEAVATAKSTMPPDLALQIAPYLRFMRRLTPAQQAAAANLGHFPQAAQIGQDDPRVIQYARSLDRSRFTGPNSGADRKLVPAGQALGPRPPDAAANAVLEPSQPRRNDKQKRNDQLALAAGGRAAARDAIASSNDPAPPDLRVSRETLPASPGVPGRAILPTDAPLAAPSRRLPESPLTARPLTGPAQGPQLTAAPPPTAHLSPFGPSLPPGSDSTPGTVSLPTAPLPQSFRPTPVTRPVPLTAPVPRMAAPIARPRFSEAFSQMSPATVDITPEQGAVDLRRIAPARDVPKRPPPPPPSHPSRIWVELGVGRDPERIAFDWRRMVKDDPELFKSRKPFISSWARTNRLLVGPFETDKAANAFNDKLHKADHPSAFVWTSPAGQVVDPLDSQ